MITKPYYLRGSSATNGRYVSSKNQNGNGMMKNNNNRILLSKNEQRHNEKKSPSPYVSSSINNKTCSHFLPKIKIDELPNNYTNVNKNNNYAKPLKFSIEDGITYKISNGLKWYYHIPSIQLFMLKEINFNNANGLIQAIRDWNSLYSNNENYLKIYHTLVNVPEGFITVVLEQPFGASLNNIIASTGFLGESFLLTIAKNLINILHANKNAKLFCICALFFDFFEKVKLIPPLLDNKDKSCNCHLLMNQLSKEGITIDCIFSLGFVLLKLIVGNMDIKSLRLPIILGKSMKKCCLLHSLIETEKEMFQNDGKNLLLRDFLNFYSKNLEDFLCQTLSFSNNRSIDIIKKHKWISSCVMKEKVKISNKELLKVVKFAKNEKTLYIYEFMDNFSIVFHNLKKNVEVQNEYLKNVYEKTNIVHFLSLVFEIEDEEFIEKMVTKIKSFNNGEKNNSFDKFVCIENSKVKEICLNGNNNVYISNK